MSLNYLFIISLNVLFLELRAAHPGVPDGGEQRDGGGGRGHQDQQHPARHSVARGATGMADSRGILSLPF